MEKRNSLRWEKMKKIFKKWRKCNRNIFKNMHVCLGFYCKHYKSVFKYQWIPPWSPDLCPKASNTANSPDQLIDFRLQSSARCMEKSPRHGKMVKTWKITLKRKFTENEILIQQNFKSRKQKDYGFNVWYVAIFKR